MTAPFAHRMRVRFAECDPQGIVFNSRYLEYFDVLITELWRETIGPYEVATADAGVEMVVAEARIRYLSPLRFDEEFELRATVSRLGTTSITTAIAVVRGESVVAEGELRHVFLARGGNSKAEIPAVVRSGLVPFVAHDDDPTHT